MQMLVLTSWIIGLVTGHSYKAFPVKHVAISPSLSEEVDPLDFIADALEIWQAKERAEHWPLILCLCTLAVLVLTFWVGLRQLQRTTWKVITKMAHTLLKCLFLGYRKEQCKSMCTLVT